MSELVSERFPSVRDSEELEEGWIRASVLEHRVEVLQLAFPSPASSSMELFSTSVSAPSAASAVSAPSASAPCRTPLPRWLSACALSSACTSRQAQILARRSAYLSVLLADTISSLPSTYTRTLRRLRSSASALLRSSWALSCPATSSLMYTGTRSSPTMGPVEREKRAVPVPVTTSVPIPDPISGGSSVSMDTLRYMSM
mmetsp:Transcript_9716/g.21589  ORF Transcript_9716/g.21589 Transcript_9716/m.21589 type:complete len:200 (+) Transcript_9716:1205-1804(+)